MKAIRTGLAAALMVVGLVASAAPAMAPTKANAAAQVPAPVPVFRSTEAPDAAAIVGASLTTLGVQPTLF